MMSSYNIRLAINGTARSGFNKHLGMCLVHRCTEHGLDNIL